MIDGWSTGDYLGGASMVVSVISSLVAISARNAAKRQADAMLGELAPVFSAHQPLGREFSSNVDFVVNIENRNFRPLNIKRIEVQFPADIIVFRDNGTSLDLVRAHRAKGARTFEFEPPLRAGPRETFEDADALTFTCQWKSSDNRVACRVGIGVFYTIDGRRETECGYASVEVFPPAHNW